VRDLFGVVKDKRDRDGDPDRESDADRGQAGCVILDDVWLDDQAGWIMPHNSIDRFTGGVRQGFLFSEELAEGGQASLHLAIVRGPKLGKETVEALRLALSDLVEGRLAIGAGGGKGHGYCGGEIRWSDDGAWINGARA
jgi:hypothetical protein